MQRTFATASKLGFVPGAAGAWLTRRWYYTPASRRAYSVRPIAPGDRRLLAEFVVAVQEAATAADDDAGMRGLGRLLLEGMSGAPESVGYVALESTSAGDRVIGAAAFAPDSRDGADFVVAVASNYRDEQVGRTLLTSLVRQARRVGLTELVADTSWSNRGMRALAAALGFSSEAHPRDRALRRLRLALK
jgi:acetyltransferase